MNINSKTWEKKKLKKLMKIMKDVRKIIKE